MLVEDLAMVVGSAASGGDVGRGVVGPSLLPLSEVVVAEVSPLATLAIICVMCSLFPGVCGVFVWWRAAMCVSRLCSASWSMNEAFVQCVMWSVCVRDYRAVGAAVRRAKTAARPRNGSQRVTTMRDSRVRFTAVLGCMLWLPEFLRSCWVVGLVVATCEGSSWVVGCVLVLSRTLAPLRLLECFWLPSSSVDGCIVLVGGSMSGRAV